MPNSRTHDEARQDYKQVMGEDLGTVYHLLWNECAILHMHWEEYVDLFGKGQDEFDVMNEAAPGFFKAVQDMYWESTLLHICRFTDPYKVGPRLTLSLEQLTMMPLALAVPNLKALVDSAREKAKFAKDWRDRSLAHTDLEHAKDKSVKPLAPASRTHVRDALEAITDVLKAVEGHFNKADLYFSGAGSSWGTHLLNQLRAFSRLSKDREQRINSGNPREDDFDYAKWRGI
jgi:hypothetical protein